MKKNQLFVTFAVLLLVILSVASAAPPSRECRDGIDNDGDGYIDWPQDPGCENKNDNELNSAYECDDGIDNDGDGVTDSSDAGCSTPTDNDETNCGDGICETQESCSADCGVADSCQDTDGTNQFSAGTVSGYLNNNLYSIDDSCQDADNVVENICSGNYASSSVVNCGSDFTTDFCQDGDVYTNTIDNFCGSGKCQSSNTTVLKQDCEFGCNQGACLPPPDSCSDTDGGYVVSSQGTVSGYSSGQQYSITDSCSGSTLTEYYCSASLALSSAHDCGQDSLEVYCAGDTLVTNSTTRGCSSGACIQSSSIATQICEYGCSAGTCNPAPEPDLEVVSLSHTLYAANATSPAYVYVESLIQNTGDGVAASFVANVTRLGASYDSSIGSLASGQYAMVSDYYECSQNHTFVINLDKNDDVAESNEFNNVGYKYISCQ